ncbi:hypothetical protein H6G17_05955 [Chroococcidiopsis sp. FACHB-1243]|uniref:hypothetical protein n=1 Tax=Chroococcidiopsis sp. [FACHB-1243] TaxID=2692781 RepID=UPI00177CB9FA|nr:hypothetical protein [Chroococcidiopsis sp. [FACHB-1243]]MBD2305057.1 hypothetical protein [Chroococcidiopsis sp. [FACHB-1243]]
MAKSSNNGDTPRRYETQIPDFKRDPKTNWSWANSNGTSNLNLKFESDTGNSKPQENKPKIDY